jgi:hypothetical protein
MSISASGSSTNFFLELIDTGKIRTKEELRSLYHKVIKTYHPDSRPARDRGVDFDDLKRDYLAAAERLAELAAQELSAAPFGYDAEAFMSELRDLVARGLPVSERAVKKNKAYAASIDYVSKCIEHLYARTYGFAELDGQLKFLRRRIPRVYYYALQVFWSCFDCANGYLYAKTIAARHLGCISYTLVEMGFGSLDRFLRDLIESAGKLASKARLARRGRT